MGHSNPPTTLDLFKLLRTVAAWSIAALPVVAAIAGVLWLLHQGAQAQAVKLREVDVRLSQIETRDERSARKLDKIADDVVAIKEALGVEKGWRKGLLQSLPRSE